MAQAHMTDIEINRDKHGLCLLSLDGDGVRGLSTLYILQELMERINSVRRENELPAVKPCEVFDLIGGISYGGIIAIMLGRLEMDVHTCIRRYISSMEDELGQLGTPFARGLEPDAFEAGMKDILSQYEDPETALLDDNRPEPRRCRAFVCAVRKANKSIARLRTYPCDTTKAEESATIWQAALATCATSPLFDPDRIEQGYYGQEYVDQTLGEISPLNEVWAEAQDIWMPKQGRFESMVKYRELQPTLKIFQDIATQAEHAEHVFAISHRDLLDAEQRYFRFNKAQELRKDGVRECRHHFEVEDATTHYLNSEPIRNQIQKCAVNLSHKRFWDGEQSDYSKLITPSSVSFNDQFTVPFYPSRAREAVPFVGRENILSLMEQNLLSPKGPLRKVVVLFGMGGVGKTQTAIHFARQHQQAYDAILWFDARDEDTLQRSFLDIAEKLPSGAIPQELLEDSQDLLALNELVQAVKRWLELPGNERWLLIFDNADSPTYNIQNYFPETRQGSIIVTTRLQGLGIGTSIDVSKLSKNEGISILAQTSGRVDLGQDPDVGELLELLDGNALALFSAGTFLSLSMITIAEYLQEYFQVLSTLLTTPKLSSYDVSLSRTWNISLNLLRQQDKAAAQLLQLWAYFDNQDVWFELLATGTEDVPMWLKTIVQSESTFMRTMENLHNYGFIDGPNHSGGFGMHTVLHDWILNVANDKIEPSMISLALGCICSLVPTKLKTNGYPLQRRLLPHANRCLKIYMDVQVDDRYQVRTPSSGDSFHVLGMLYHDQGKLKEAETMYQLALNEKERVLGPDNPSTLHTMDDLGLLYNSQGKLGDAKSMFEQALKGFRQELGSEHPSTLRTMNNLGALYTAQGKWQDAESLLLLVLAGFKNLADPAHIPELETINNLGLLYSNEGRLTEAEAMYRRALAGYEEAVGPEHPLTLIIAGNLGNIFANQGLLDEAESMDIRALNGLEKALGPEHTSTLEVVNNLANLYTKKGKLHQAETMYLRVIIEKEKALGTEHTSTLNTVNNLANLYSDSGELEKAEALYQRALNGYKRALGQEHWSTLSVINNLASLYHLEGKLDEAEALYSMALEGGEKILGLQHPSTLDTISNLANLYSSQGKLDEAEALYSRALEGKEKALGPEHPSTLNTISNMARLYSNTGKLDEAEALYLRALAGEEGVLGREHPSTLNTISNLANLYSNTSKLDEAEALYLRALAGEEGVLGREHPSTLNTISNLANLYSNQGKLDEAEALYSKALEGKERVLGSEHPSTLNTVNNIANLYSNQGKLDEAEALYHRALKGKEKALGPEHLSTLDIISNLANLYNNQGKLDEAETLYRRALEGKKKALGPEHRSTLNTINNLANLYSNQGKLDEAETLYRKALIEEEKILGLEHQPTLKAIDNLADVFILQGKLEEAVSMKLTILRNHRRLMSDQESTSSAVLDSLTDMLDERNDLSALRTSTKWQEVVNSHQERLDKRSDVRLHDTITLTTARSEVLEALQQFSASDSELVEFTLFWDVPNFRSQECSDGQQLGSVLVLIGNEYDVLAIDCASYADQILPGVGHTILNAIDGIVAGKSMHASAFTDQLGFSITQKMNRSGSNEAVATICCYAQPKFILDFTEVLLWLCAALRVSSLEQPSRSRALLGKDFSGSHPRILVALSDLQPMEVQNGACWHTLLPRSVIADGFSIPPRKGEKGLEAPLAVMMGLSGITTAFEIGGQYYFMGLTSALIPTQKFGEESIQWHLIRGPQNSIISRQDLPEISVLSTNEFGPTDINIKYVLENISRRRHFVGWCEKAYVRLGTKDATFNTQRTGLHEKSKSIDVQSFGGTAGTSGLGIFSFLSTVTWHVSQTRIEPSGEDSRHYESILLQARRTPYIVYDVDTKSAWLVPAICLILHMIHLRIRADQIPMAIPFASRHWDSGNAAYKVLSEHRNLAQDTTAPSKPLKLESIVREIWTSLSACKQTRAEKQLIGDQYKLLAYELMDIAMRDSGIRLKWTDVCNTGGWPELTGIVERVLVCRGIGDAICRVSEDSVSGWLRMPENNHLLCATATCLKALSERVGRSSSHLLDNRVWKYSNHLQKVVSAGKTPAQLPAFPDSGAFIFGDGLTNTSSTKVSYRDAHNRASEDGHAGDFTQEGIRADDVASTRAAPSHLAASSQASSSRRSSFYSIGRNPPISISSIYIQDEILRNGTAEIENFGRTDETRRLRRMKRSSDLPSYPAPSTWHTVLDSHIVPSRPPRRP